MLQTLDVKMQTDCVLLQNFETFQNRIVGVKLVENFFQIDSKYFSCCSGTAMRIEGDLTLRCDLKKRIAMMNALLRQFIALWPMHLEFLSVQLQETVDEKAIQKLMPKSTRNKVTKGLVLVSTNQSESNEQSYQPSRLWFYAFYLIWNHGFSVHMINFMKTPSVSLLSTPMIKINSSTQMDSRRVLVFCEQICNLWDPNNLIKFEAIVQDAYNRISPLWTHFVIDQKNQTQSSQSKKSFTVKEQIASRIHKTKAKSTLSYLSPEARDRFMSICEVSPHTFKEYNQ